MKNIVRELTRERLVQQEIVPLSPGQIGRNGEPLLCFGAALVASHLQATRGVRAAQSFARRIVKASSSTSILQEAENTGFSATLCRMAIITNDECSESERKSAILDLLASFAI